jgi:predicted N-acetyltransferase YhbS
MSEISQPAGWPPIETIDRHTISPADARAISELVVSIWPRPGRTVDNYSAIMLAEWHNYNGPDAQRPRSFLIREGGRVVAHASAYPRTIATTQGEITVLALARVCTDPTVRGKRYGDALVRLTFKLVDDGSFPFALFQTSTQVGPFYERLGAIAINNRFINSLAPDPEADPFWAEVRMRYPATGDWPEGTIDLRGPGW